MGEPANESTCGAGYLIEPKEEILDDLVITDSCEDDKDPVIPKEELSNSSVHLADDMNEQNADMVMPIKTELTLCDNIAEVRRQYESSERDSVSDKDANTEHTTMEIKIEPEPYVPESNIDYNPEQGPSNVNIITRKYIFDRIQQENAHAFKAKLDNVEKKFLCTDYYSDEQIKEMKHNFSYLKTEFKKRWIAARYKTDTFLAKNNDWLEGTFELPKISTRATGGQPTKDFDEASDRSKRRKTEKLCKSSVAIQSIEKRDTSKVSKVLIKSPKRETKYKKASHSGDNSQLKSLTPSDALAMVVEANLTRTQYELLRNIDKRVYPSYNLIKKAKTECYPNKDAYTVTETCAETNLESLLEHTARRLILYLGNDILDTLTDLERKKLVMILKWGCDGSQQTRSKEKFENDASSDSNIFQSSFVPLQLFCESTDKVVWRNPTPWSPKFCRPIRIRLVKETDDVTEDEIAYISNSIQSLPGFTTIKLENNEYDIKFEMSLTTVDGKICNTATDIVRCRICNETSKDFNKLNPETDVDPDTIWFGMSILHARICLFESILHLAYELPLKKGRLHTKDKKDEEIVRQRKLEIHNEFKTELGLVVDVPNDGYTSRVFFAEPELAAQITGVDSELIYRFKVILETVSSGHKIDTKKFSEFAMDTAKLYVQLYPWCPMTLTVHKILIHGATIIKYALLPIGQLTEKAVKARNKRFRTYQQKSACKISREECNLYVLNHLLLISDPYISASRQKCYKQSKSFLKETLDMLLPAEPDDTEFSECSDTEDMSSNEE